MQLYSIKLTVNYCEIIPNYNTIEADLLQYQKNRFHVSKSLSRRPGLLLLTNFQSFKSKILTNSKPPYNFCVTSSTLGVSSIVFSRNIYDPISHSAVILLLMYVLIYYFVTVFFMCKLLSMKFLYFCVY